MCYLCWLLKTVPSDIVFVRLLALIWNRINSSHWSMRDKERAEAEFKDKIADFEKGLEHKLSYDWR